MNFERLSAGHMKQQTGLNRQVAKRHLLSALSNFYKRADGRTYLQHRLSREEQTIVQFCASRSAARSAFTGEGLFRDFQRVLISNKLLEEQEKRLLDAAKPFVILSAIPFYFHQEPNIITLEDGWTCRLAGGCARGRDRREREGGDRPHLTFRTNSPRLSYSPTSKRQIGATRRWHPKRSGKRPSKSQQSLRSFLCKQRQMLAGAALALAQ